VDSARSLACINYELLVSASHSSSCPCKVLASVRAPNSSRSDRGQRRSRATTCRLRSSRP
jgi:hypothetical protein